MHPFYTSRSAIETYQECPRRRWLGYLYRGIGLQQAQVNVPLTTGTCVHEGIGFLLRNVMLGLIPSVEQHYLAYETNWLDLAVNVALQTYTKMVWDSGLETKDQNAEFVYQQELARTEALIRAWSIAELPLLVKNFKVYSVENEIVIPLTSDIIFQARVDAILQDVASGQMFNYSLKTMKAYKGEKTDRVFNMALQTITEAWAAEHKLKEDIKLVKTFLEHAGSRMQEEKKFQDLSRFVYKYVNVPVYDRIYGTKHCFLVKGGKGEENDFGEFIAGDSPLIRGYKTGDRSNGTSYCHSYYYPNPSNKSGKGSIGKTWQQFNVWQEMTIKEWIALLNSKVQDHTGQMVYEIQPECGDVIKQQVITPGEVFTNREVTESTLYQIQVLESEVKQNLDSLRGCMNDTYGSMLDQTFPMNRQSCLWPTTCEFLPICHLKNWRGDGVDKSVRNDPVGSGLFKLRVPHHQKEFEVLNEKNLS